MKHTFRILLLLVLSWSLMPGKAQRPIGVENLIPEKNFFIGIKGGITAMDMQYKKDNDAYVNHSALYQGFGNILDCMTGGVYAERSIPHFSYGIELSLCHINAKDPNNQNQYTQDSAFIASVRIPLRMKFMEEKTFSPYIILSPGVSTYLSDSIAGISFNSCSVWDGKEEKWDKNNTKRLNISMTAGIGVEAKIPVMLYEIRARLEVGYNLGLLNMTPQALDFERKMRGWEATIGLAFPLFTNPGYVWLN